MKTLSEKLEQWAVRKIETEFPGDVCLLLYHDTLRLDKDSGKIGFGSYVPNTSRASGLARTFIIDGIGYDLFPRTWESLEKMADVNHYNLTCLDDGVVIWARSEADKRRFESLQERLRANLKNPQLLLERAQNWVNTASELYADMLFEEKTHIVRQNAGYICDLLAIAVAYSNGTFFRRGQNAQLEEIRKMRFVPHNFTGLYEKIVFEKNPEEQKKLCHCLLRTLKDHISSLTQDGKSSKYDASELASWYHELSYTWRRIYHYCEIRDALSAYLWGCMLQNELGEVVQGYNDPGIDILSAFDAENLSAFAEYAAEAERAIISAIEADGGKLDIYATVDEFLKKNQ
jgi:hypothetical protein